MKMSEEKKQLTPEDPISPEILAQFEELTVTKQKLAQHLLLLEQEKVGIIRSSIKIDDQQKRLFETSLVERGLPPDAEVEIDSKTGVLTLSK